MQGFGGNAVLFLVDGERLAGETLDNIDYNRLNLDNVERVEIVKARPLRCMVQVPSGG